MRTPLVLLFAGLAACSFDWSDKKGPPEVDAGDGDGAPADGDASGPLDTPDGSEDGCNDGFEVEGAACIDIECVRENGGCAHLCTNSEGSFTCSCDPGHSLASDGASCTPFAWSEPVLLELREDDAVASRVVVDRDGNATAVWSFGFEGIWSNRYVPGQGWQGAVAVEAPTDNARNLVAGVASNGDVLAVWDTQYNGNNVRWARATRDGWGPPAVLVPNALLPTLYVDGDRAVAVGISTGSDSVQTVSTHHYRTGSGWSSAQRLDVGAGSVREAPKFAIGADGRAHAVWSARLERDQSAWVGQTDERGVWEQPALLERTGEIVPESDGVHIVALPDDSRLTAWTQVDSAGRSTTWTARITSDGSISVPAVLADPNGVSGGVDALAADQSGSAIAVGSSSAGVWAARYTGGRWQDARVVSATGLRRGLVMDGMGNAVLLLQDVKLRETRFNARRDTWSEPRVVSHNSVGLVGRSSIALDREGHAFVVWTQGVGNRDVWAARLEECSLSAGCDRAWPPRCEPAGSEDCTCPAGFERSAELMCADVDECATNLDTCDDEPNACKNLEGGYYCQCPTNYTGNGVGDDGCVESNPWD